MGFFAIEHTFRLDLDMGFYVMHTVELRLLGRR